MVRVHQAHIAHAKMRARKVNLLHPTHKASRKVNVARQPNAGEQMLRGAARHDRHDRDNQITRRNMRKLLSHSIRLGWESARGAPAVAHTSAHHKVASNNTQCGTHAQVQKSHFFANRYAAAN